MPCSYLSLSFVHMMITAKSKCCVYGSCAELIHSLRFPSSLITKPIRPLMCIIYASTCRWFDMRLRVMGRPESRESVRALMTAVSAIWRMRTCLSVCVAPSLPSSRLAVYHPVIAAGIKPTIRYPALLYCILCIPSVQSLRSLEYCCPADSDDAMMIIITKSHSTHHRRGSTLMCVSVKTILLLHFQIFPSNTTQWRAQYE